MVRTRSSARILGGPDEGNVVLSHGHGMWVRRRRIRRTWKVR